MQTIIGKDILAAKKFLEEGNVIGIPTETVYGLAGNALDADAVLRIFTVKNRPHFDPLIVHTHQISEIEKYVTDMPPQARLLLEKFSPGPLTVLLPRKKIIPDLVTSGLETVAIRIPAHPLTLELLRQLSFPLAAPSANPFGYISPTSSYHVYDQLHGRIPYILDGGTTDVGVESTIVGFEGTQPVIYRLGGLPVEEIERVAGKAIIRVNNSSNPQAPGQLQSHYAPRKKLYLLPHGETAITDNKAGVLAFDTYLTGIAKEQQLLLTENGNLREAAKNLFAFMRKLDAMEVSCIYAVQVPDTGLGKAINDRLRRAAA